MTEKPQQPNLAILYSFRRCPYAMRARMALMYSGVNVYLREVELKNKPQALIQCSTKATVPVLVLDNGTIVDESRDIMQWALAQNDPDNWQFKHDTRSIQCIQELLEHNDSEFKNHLDHYKYADRYSESVEHYRSLGEEYLNTLENKLVKQRFLIAETISIADIAIFPFIRQFAQVDTHWFANAPYPYLQAWLDYLLQSELFNRCMDKYPPWDEGLDNAVVFGGD